MTIKMEAQEQEWTSLSIRRNVFKIAEEIGFKRKERIISKVVSDIILTEGKRIGVYNGNVNKPEDVTPDQAQELNQEVELERAQEVIRAQNESRGEE